MIHISDEFIENFYKLMGDTENVISSILCNKELEHAKEETIVDADKTNPLEEPLLNKPNKHQKKKESKNEGEKTEEKIEKESKLIMKQILLVKAGILPKLFSILKNFMLHVNLYKIDREKYMAKLYEFLSIFKLFTKNNPLICTYFLDKEVIKYILLDKITTETLNFYRDILTIVADNDYRINPMDIILGLKEKIKSRLNSLEITILWQILKVLRKSLEASTKKSVNLIASEISLILSYLFKSKISQSIFVKFLKTSGERINIQEHIDDYKKSQDIRSQKDIHRIMFNFQGDLKVEDYASAHKGHGSPNNHNDYNYYKSDSEKNPDKEEENEIDYLDVEEKSFNEEKIKEEFNLDKQRQEFQEVSKVEVIGLLKSFIKLIFELPPDEQTRFLITLNCSKEIKKLDIGLDFEFLSKLILMKNNTPIFRQNVIMLYNKYILKFPFLKHDLLYKYEKVYDLKKEIPNQNFEEIFMNKNILYLRDVDYSFILNEQQELIIYLIEDFPGYLERFYSFFRENPKSLLQYFVKGIVGSVYNHSYIMCYYFPIKN